MKSMEPRQTDLKLYIYLGTGFLLLATTLLLLANYVDGFALWYSVNVYAVLTAILGRMFGVVPFSVVEILLYIAVVVLLILTVRLLAGVVRKKAGSRYFAGRMAAGIFCVGAGLFVLYTVGCGVNYQRTSFAESSGIQIQAYTVEELADVCLRLTEDVNSRAELVERDENGVMVYEDTLRQDAVNAMEALAQKYPDLQGYYPEPKEVMLPWVLSVQKITGIYSPFTFEANYNGAITDYNVPFSACHELSHLRGFMREDEANFIAYLACMDADGVDFQYSGSMRGWTSCMNVLYRADQEKWAEIRVLLNSQAEADLAANRQYWAGYDGRIAEFSEKINDNYLKANGQAAGIQSYGRMADLIVAYYRN